MAPALIPNPAPAARVADSISMIPGITIVVQLCDGDPGFVLVRRYNAFGKTAPIANGSFSRMVRCFVVQITE